MRTSDLHIVPKPSRLLDKQNPANRVIDGVDSLSGADRDRTGDPLLAKQVLSQLSYRPEGTTSLQVSRFPGPPQVATFPHRSAGSAAESSRLSTNRVGFTSKFGVGAQNGISVRDPNRVGATNTFCLGVQNGISVRDPNRVGYTSKFGLGAQNGISVRGTNHVGFASKFGLGPKSGILGSSGAHGQRKQEE